MSNPDLNSSAPVAVNGSIVSASNTNSMPPSQLPPSPYRAIASLQPNPFQQGHHLLYSPYFTVRRPYSVTGSPQHLHQDPSAMFFPFPPLGRGFPSPQVRPSSHFVAGTGVMGGNPSGFPPNPNFTHNQGQFGPNQVESMMQFTRARYPQYQQFPQPGSGSPVGMGPMRGNPHFLQPRVSPPSTSILDTSGNRTARKRDDVLVLVRGRKVRITEGASLYSLGRSWLRNGGQEGFQIQRSGTMEFLPKALPVSIVETSLANDSAEEPSEEEKDDEESVEHLSEKDLLKRHIQRAKKIRAKLKAKRLRKIARSKERIGLVLSNSREQ